MHQLAIVLLIIIIGFMLSSFFWDQRLRKKNPALHKTVWIAEIALSAVLVVYFIVNQVSH